MFRWTPCIGFVCVLGACGPSMPISDVPIVDTGASDVVVDNPTVDVPASPDVADVIKATDVGVDVGVDVVVVDASTTDAGGLVLRRGGLSSLGPRPAATGGVRVIDDGFEVGGRLCAGNLCVTGGIVP